MRCYLSQCWQVPFETNIDQWHWNGAGNWNLSSRKKWLNYFTLSIPWRWWPGNIRSQGIKRYGNDQVYTEYSVACMGRVNLIWFDDHQQCDWYCFITQLKWILVLLMLEVDYIYLGLTRSVQLLLISWLFWVTRKTSGATVLAVYKS